MWKRSITARLKEVASKFPAVLILGPRQVGKTTLARMTFSEAEYMDLEDPVVAHLLKRGDIGFHLTKFGQKTVILDEAQAVPEVFAALRSIIDKKRKVNGQYVLLGSAQPALVRSLSESLAGRVGVIELGALTMEEVATGVPRYGYETVWLKGGFPDALQGDFRLWWDSYLRTFVERDLVMWGMGVDPVLMRRLLTMIAHQQGGVLNSSELGKALGVSYHTVNKYLKILEGTFLVRTLQPYYANVKKRLVKSPKVYIRDTGLLHHLLNINSQSDLDSHPIRGQSWETFVVEELIRRENARDPFSEFYFWRTQAGAEVDLVVNRGGKLFVVEVKSGKSFQAGQVSRLESAMEDIGSTEGYLVGRGESVALSKSVQGVNFGDEASWRPGV